MAKTSAQRADMCSLDPLPIRAKELPDTPGQVDSFAELLQALCGLLSFAEGMMELVCEARRTVAQLEPSCTPLQPRHLVLQLASDQLRALAARSQQAAFHAEQLLGAFAHYNGYPEPLLESEQARFWPLVDGACQLAQVLHHLTFASQMLSQTVSLMLQIRPTPDLEGQALQESSRELAHVSQHMGGYAQRIALLVSRLRTQQPLESV